jgi:hypothetical protein
MFDYFDAQDGYHVEFESYCKPAVLHRQAAGQSLLFIS